MHLVLKNRVSDANRELTATISIQDFSFHAGYPGQRKRPYEEKDQIHHLPGLQRRQDDVLERLNILGCVRIYTIFQNG